METGRSSPKIAIMVVANNVSKDVLKRFLWACEKSEKVLPFDVIVGNHREPEQKFHKTVILNDMLRSYKGKYEVLVQTDIDMLVPPRLITDTYRYCLRSNDCYHCNYYLIEPKELKDKLYKDIPWNKIQQRQVRAASGSWNGLCSRMWSESGGFCEAISLLGGPDSEFYMRTRKKNIRWYITSKFVLGHVNHPRRKVKKQGKKNLSIARKYPRDYNWLKNRNNNVGSTKIKIYSFRGNK